ncbi:MAG: DUF6265 family protein [Hyphomonadaceae bacterium]
MRALLILIALVCATPAHAQTLDDLTWLKGCWRTEAPREAETGAQTTEVWLDPPGPFMVGYSFTEGEGAVQGWEHMRIDAADGGRPRFVASPGGAPPVAFQMSEPSDIIHLGPHQPDGVAVFTNPDHDYPQSIMYVRFGNRLTATISKIDGSDPYTYAYRRFTCPTALRP